MAPSVVAVRLEDAHEVGAGNVVDVAREGQGARDVVEPGHVCTYNDREMRWMLEKMFFLRDRKLIRTPMPNPRCQPIRFKEKAGRERVNSAWNRPLVKTVALDTFIHDDNEVARGWWGGRVES